MWDDLEPNSLIGSAIWTSPGFDDDDIVVIGERRQSDEEIARIIEALSPIDIVLPPSFPAMDTPPPLVEVEFDIDWCASQSPTNPLPTQDQAVMAGLAEASSRGADFRQNEFGFAATRVEGGFSFGPVTTSNSPNSVDIRVPSNSVAWVHTHPPTGDFFTDIANRAPSPAELASHAAIEAFLGRSVTMYVLGPDGVVREFDSQGNQVDTLSSATPFPWGQPLCGSTSGP